MKYAKLFTIIAVIGMFAFVTVYAENAKPAAPVTAAPAKAELKKEVKIEKKAEGIKKAEGMMFMGKVIAVDAVKNTFTVEKEVTLKDGTKKMKKMTFEAGKEVKIADIAKDAKIHVMYKKDGDKMMAESVKPMKMEKKAEMKKEVKMEKKETAAMEKMEKKEEVKK